MSKKIIIAVDGYSSSGKSTLAKDLARELNYVYIDSGAMYRAVTLYMLQKKIDVNDKEAVIKELPNITIEFKYNDILSRSDTYLNEQNVEDLIRRPAVSEFVSEVSIIKEVRSFLVEQQKNLGKEKGIVMDGRDIGTVVFSDAELKLFITADLEARTNRRFEELKSKGMSATFEEVEENLEHRDHIDTHREESPLYKSDDALLLDNTILNRDQQLKLVLNLALNILKELNEDEEEVKEKGEEEKVADSEE